MAFIQPCFIRKNTPELRKKLEELDVNYDGFYGIENECIVTRYGPYNNTYHTLNHPPIGISYYTRKYGPMKFKCIDCKTNEKLFLALASMTDDEFGLCDYYIVTDDCNPRYAKGSIHRALPISSVIHPSCYRKATIEELIEHFNGGVKQ